MITWKAIYSDGSLAQHNSDGSENSYKQIDRSKLQSFELYDGEKLIFILNLNKNKQLIFRRRNFIPVSVKTGEESGRWTVYIVGFRFTDSSGEKHNVLNYLNPDGVVELDDERNNLELYPEEN